MALTSSPSSLTFSLPFFNTSVARHCTTELNRPVSDPETPLVKICQGVAGKRLSDYGRLARLSLRSCAAHSALQLAENFHISVKAGRAVAKCWLIDASFASTGRSDISIKSQSGGQPIRCTRALKSALSGVIAKHRFALKAVSGGPSSGITMTLRFQETHQTSIYQLILKGLPSVLVRLLVPNRYFPWYEIGTS